MNDISSIRKRFHSVHEKISTAYHEAGHTIIGLLYFMKITDVSVFTNKKTKRVEGLTFFTYPPQNHIIDNNLKKTIIESEIKFKYAGIISEQVYWEICTGTDILPFFLKEGSSSDIKSVSALISKNKITSPGKPRQRYKKAKMKETKQNVLTFWDDISLISHILFKKNKMSFSDLEKILTSKSSNKEFWITQFSKINSIYIESNFIESELKNAITK